jgi:hypothetical protein
VSIASNSAKDRFINFTNSAAFGVAAGVNSTGASTTVNLQSFTNQGSGSVTLGAASRVNVANFQSYGLLTLNPATVGSGQFTLLTYAGTSPMLFSDASRTYIGTPATANSGGSPAFVAGIDLHGQNAVVVGGLFVNNGFVVDSSNGGTGTGTIIADFGALVKGSGFYQNAVITQNGGRFQAGNSPGKSTVGSETLGPGGTQNFLWQINNATGTAGPTPDANNQISGWSLVLAYRGLVGEFFAPGNLTWTATPAAGTQFQFALQTLMNPTTVGSDNPGPMANFDPSRNYMWQFVSYMGTYTGPTGTPAQIDAQLTADTLFDATGFVNPIHGTFSLHLDQPNKLLDVVYTPSSVPEPGTLGLIGVAGAGFALRRRYSRARV